MSTIITLRDAPERPLCELVLDSGERLRLALDRDGFTIERMSADATAELLFRGDVEAAAAIYAAFAPRARQPSR